MYWGSIIKEKFHKKEMIFPHKKFIFPSEITCTYVSTFKKSANGIVDSLVEEMQPSGWKVS